jgi:MFS family permease
VRRLINILAPARLGPEFRRLLAAFWLYYAADGISIAAGPLLIASLSHNAFLIASGALLQWLPQLVFGLWAGVVSDRMDRRLIVTAVELLRAGVVAVLAVTIATGTVTVALALSVLFLIGSAEVFSNNASGTLLPMLVSRADLAIGNARLQTGLLTWGALAGPPIGAALFVLGRDVPFLAQAVLVAAGAVIVSRIRIPGAAAGPREERDSIRGARHDIAEGVRWTWRHPAVSTLVLTIFTFNITFGAAWSVLVLYAKHRLGLNSFGFGLITTVQALGGLLGTMTYSRIVRRISLGNIMRIGLIIETLTHLGLALARSPWVAMPIFFVFGVHAFVWGTTSVTVRQRVVPTHLQGRVNSVNTVGVFGGLVIGSAIGGTLAQHIAIVAPFWFAFGGSAVFLVLIWRRLLHIGHEDADATA